MPHNGRQSQRIGLLAALRCAVATQKLHKNIWLVTTIFFLTFGRSQDKSRLQKLNLISQKGSSHDVKTTIRSFVSFRNL
jgi:hypothetical protein